MRPIAILLCCLSIIAAPRAIAQPRDGTAAIRFYVAASTKEAAEKIAQEFSQQSGVAVEVSPGPSSKLAKQIVDGAPADLFLSADQANAEYLEEKHLVAQRRTLLRNRLVVVVPADSRLAITQLADLAANEIREIAVALEKVPAGEYARQALRHAGVWDRVKGNLIGGEDVRATLAFVERGATAGIVYFTDTIGSSKVRIAFEIPAAMHSPIEYSLVLIQRDKPKAAALQLFERLTSQPAAAVFQKAGFRIADDRNEK